MDTLKYVVISQIQLRKLEAQLDAFKCEVDHLLTNLSEIYIQKQGEIQWHEPAERLNLKELFSDVDFPNIF